MGQLDGKVALITGGARGQGRAHAVRMAESGADIVVTDIAEQLPTVPYPLATKADLDETVAQVEALDRRCLGLVADARDITAMRAATELAVAEFGRLDILVVNHGIGVPATWDSDDAVIDDILDTNLKGAFNACRAAIPHLIDSRGSIVLTSSAAGLRPLYQMTAYSISKHGVIGIMRNLAAELAPHRVRVNVICPGVVDTPMVMNDRILSMFSGRQTGGTRADAEFAGESMALLPEPWLDPRDIANAALWLASDEARYVTGIVLPIDLGQNNQPVGVPPIAHHALAAHLANNTPASNS